MEGDLFELIELDALRCMHIYGNMVNMRRTINHHINSLLALEISDAPPIANAFRNLDQSGEMYLRRFRFLDGGGVLGRLEVALPR
jgi:hypothetical protein